ncbi:response regulator [Methanoplanus sp. FWC-SCC4]|uniref:Response regulator n=1 Tax=Methanochimaera problematica TaxID=2609417 RepID=A0AA97I3I2_9EURY|nr:response regulator [Methanoplanus sp. FWC-SCC4]WOF15241.1 response regulator [Methanoplanus sp. FWC-SCC4]
MFCFQDFLGGAKKVLHILMVDEEPDILEIAEIFLKKYGEYDIDRAYSAKEGLYKLQEGGYDAIVSDYEMPEMDGLTFLGEVRRLNPLIPFIIFSGKGREEVVGEAFRRGADGFVQKGKDPRSQFAELNHQIVIASERSRAENELKMKEYAIESSFNGVFMMDSDLRLFYVNKAAIDFYGYKSKDEMLNKRISAYFDMENFAEMNRNACTHLFEKGWFLGEVKGRKKDSSLFDIQLSAISVKNEITSDVYYFGSFIDITDKKITERVLVEFISEAAKRLKEPVGYISSGLHEAVGLIEKEGSSEKLKLMLSVQMKTAEQVLENLNDLNRVIAGGIDSLPEEYKEYLIR